MSVSKTANISADVSEFVKSFDWNGTNKEDEDTEEVTEEEQQQVQQVTNNEISIFQFIFIIYIISRFFV